MMIYNNNGNKEFDIKGKYYFKKNSNLEWKLKVKKFQ